MAGKYSLQHLAQEPSQPPSMHTPATRLVLLDDALDSVVGSIIVLRQALKEVLCQRASVHVA